MSCLNTVNTVYTVYIVYIVFTIQTALHCLKKVAIMPKYFMREG